MKNWTRKLKVTFYSIWASLVLAGMLGSALPQLPADADAECCVLSDGGKKHESPLEDLDEVY